MALYSLLAVGLTLAVLEGLLHLAIQHTQRMSLPEEAVAAHVEAGVMRFDPALGWTWEHLPQPEMGLSSQGFRYREIPQVKPTGTLRIFTLGDSQTYGAHLDADETYSAIAEIALQRSHPELGRVEVINAGISGYTSLQMLRLIEHKILAYGPDLIVADIPPFDSPRDTHFNSGFSAGPAWLRQLAFKSRIYYLLQLGLRDLSHDKDAPIDFELEPHRPRPHYPPGKPGNHDLIAKLGRLKGFETVFIDYPAERGGQLQCHSPRDALPERANILKACPLLHATGLSVPELFYDGNHLTEAGAAHLGQALATFIERRGLLGISGAVTTPEAGALVPVGPPIPPG